MSLWKGRCVEESLFPRFCLRSENPRVRRVDLPEARKKEGNEKRREILFLLEVWRYGRMVRWKGDEKKEKSPVDVRVDGLKRYELEARRSSHSLRLPGWIKLREGRKEGERYIYIYIQLSAASTVIFPLPCLRGFPLDINRSVFAFRFVLLFSKSPRNDCSHPVGIPYQLRTSRVPGQVSRSSPVT